MPIGIENVIHTLMGENAKFFLLLIVRMLVGITACKLEGCFCNDRKDNEDGVDV